MKNILRLLALFALCLLLAMPALGEEPFHQTESGLIADGCFPEPFELSGDVSKATLSSFDSYMLPKLKSLSNYIDVTRFSLSPNDFSEVYWDMLNRNPEYFYVSGAYSYYTSGSIVSAIIPQYRYSASSIPGRITKFENAVGKVVDYAQKSSTQVGQLLRAYDYFCANYEYDETYTYYQPDEFFTKGKGVCNAYTLAYCAVLNALDIPSDTTSSKSMNHIWNMVNLNGKWYHIDVTWGDPVSDMPLRTTHDSFLRSDDGIMESGHYGWTREYYANSAKYDNFFWKDISHPLSMQGDTIYYVSNSFSHPNRTIYAHDLTTGTTSPFYSYTYKTSGSYYSDYNPIWILGTDVYYVTGHELYHGSTLGGTPARVLSTGSGTTVWGINRVGDTLKLYAANGYHNDGQIYTYDVNIDYDIALSKPFIHLTVGDKQRLKFSITPDPTYEIPLTWTLDPADAGFMRLSTAAGVTALTPGATCVTATLPDGSSDSCLILVHDDKPLTIPAGTKVITQDAFRGVAAQEIVLPEGVTRIESGAFADCLNLRLINLPDTLTYIAPDAFLNDSFTWLRLVCESEDGYAARYAKENKLPYWVAE